MYDAGLAWMSVEGKAYNAEFVAVGSWQLSERRFRSRRLSWCMLLLCCTQQKMQALHRLLDYFTVDQIRCLFCLYFYFFSLSFSLSILFCFAATLDVKRLCRNERLIITVRQIFLWSSIFSIDRTYFSWIFGTQKILLNNFWSFYDPICPNNSRKLFDKIDGDQNCVVRCYRSLKCFPRNMGGLWNCNAAACRS